MPESPDPEIAAPGDGIAGVDVANLEKQLRERSLELWELRRIWETRDRRAWAASPGFYEWLAEDLRRRGEVFWCYDVATEGLELGAQRLRLRQLQALALADSGAPRAAGTLLEKLLVEEGSSAETLGLLARTHKDLARDADSEEQRRSHLEKARNYYQEAFGLFGGYYTGINAASLALLTGERELALALATEVQALCDAEADGESNLWNVATRAESALILGRVGEATSLYRDAVKLAGREFTVIASMRRQALLLAGGDVVDHREIEACFRLPPIVVFSGHRIDAPDRDVPRFPQADAQRAKRWIREQVDAIDAQIGYASAASGGDILFLEAMLERGAEVHVILPFSRDAFYESSVRVPGDRCQWKARYDAVLEQATSVTSASDQEYASSARLYDYANELIFGLALQRSRSLATTLCGLALWDGQASGGPGSTADALANWCLHGCPARRIDPKSGDCGDISAAELGINSPAGPRLTPAAIRSGTPRHRPSFEDFLSSECEQEVKAILFADVVGFSRLKDGDLPAYMYHFMGGVGALVDGLGNQPRSRNTWGDAFHFVFDRVADAARLALALREFVEDSDWRHLGMQRDLGIRIALHAGTVFSFTDPVTGRPNYLGHHVNRTARIEPIAEEGQIYASESFAALAAFQANDLVECDYAGQRILPKGFGSDRIFIVRQRSNRQ